MATNKKGIIVYADWIDKFEELEDDEAGRLIKHFFRYVNDLNPEYPDRTTKLMFIDIKNTLKRDLNRWEDKSPQRSKKARLAGLASAEARKLKKQLNSTNELEVQLNPTQSTVSVSVSVSDTVSVNESVTVTEINIDEEEDEYKANSDFKKALTNKWITDMGLQYKRTPTAIKNNLDEFLKHLRTELKIHPSQIEFIRHFKSWLNKIPNKNGNNTATLEKQPYSFDADRAISTAACGME